MTRRCVVTVVLSTFNRARLLGPAIDALLGQCSSAPEYEVIVVDNNSTDDTASVIQSRLSAAGSTGRLRYVFEPEQGLSNARNAGIAGARSDIVAFTDDDVRVRADWVRVIKESFDAHPEIACLSGPILPVWESTPPVWLTPRHWLGPLALQDYGDKPLVLDRRTPFSLAGANFAFRGQVFDRIGGFSPAYARAEDSEFLLRFWRHGYRARYVPAMIIDALVPPERMTKPYHRRWHVHTGSFTRLAEELSAAVESPRIARILGVPRSAITELAAEALAWFGNAWRGGDADAFWHEGQLRELVAYMRESREHHRRNRVNPTLVNGSSPEVFTARMESEHVPTQPRIVE